MDMTSSLRESFARRPGVFIGTGVAVLAIVLKRLIAVATGRSFSPAIVLLWILFLALGTLVPLMLQYQKDKKAAERDAPGVPVSGDSPSTQPVGHPAEFAESAADALDEDDLSLVESADLERAAVGIDAGSAEQDEVPLGDQEPGAFDDVDEPVWADAISAFQQTHPAEEPASDSPPDPTPLPPQFVEAIEAVRRVLAGSGSPEEALGALATELHRTVPFDRVSIETADQGRGTVTDIFSMGVEVSGRQFGQSRPIAGTIADAVVGQRQGMLVQPEDAAALTATFRGLGPEMEAGLQSYAAAPLWSGGVVAGTLQLQATRPNAFSEHELAYLENVSTLVQEFIVLDTPSPPTPQPLPDESPGHDTLTEIRRIAGAAADFDSLAPEFPQLVRSLIPFDRLAVFVGDLDNASLITIYEVGIAIPLQRTGVYLRNEDTLFDRIVQGRLGLIAGAPDDDPTFAQFRAHSQAIEVGLLSMVSVPIVHEDRVVGILELRAGGANVYGEANLATAHTVAEQIAPAVAVTQTSMAGQDEAGLPSTAPTVVQAQPPPAGGPQAPVDPDLPSEADNYDDAEISPGALTESEEPPSLDAGSPQPYQVDAGPAVAASPPDDPGADIADAEPPPDQQSVDEDTIIQLRQEARRLEIVAELGTIIGSSNDLDGVFPRFVEKLHELVPLDRAVITYLDLEDGTATVEHAGGVEASDFSVGDTFSFHDTVIEAIVKDGQGLFAVAESPEQFASQFPAWPFSVDSGFCSMLQVPILSGDEVAGTLWLYSTTPLSYAESDLAEAEVAGAIVAGAVASSKAVLALRKESSEQELLNELGRAVGSASSLRETYQRLREQVQRLIPTDRLAITGVNQDRSILVEKYSAGVSVPGAKGPRSMSMEGTLG